MPKSFPHILPGNFSHIQFEFIEGLGSQTADHRNMLRSRATSALKTRGLELPTNPADLSRPLQHKHLHMSLSHTVDASVLAWIQKPKKLGVDLELSERIQKAIVERVSTHEEISAAPDFRLLWPAKEAVFKAHSKHLQVVGQVEICNWKALDDSSWQFSARTSPSGEILDGSGLLCLNPRHILSFFVVEG